MRVLFDKICGMVVMTVEIISSYNRYHNIKILIHNACLFVCFPTKIFELNIMDHLTGRITFNAITGCNKTTTLLIVW